MSSPHADQQTQGEIPSINPVPIEPKGLAKGIPTIRRSLDRALTGFKPLSHENAELKASEVLDGKGLNSLAEDIHEYTLRSGDKVYGATDKGIDYKDTNEDRVGVNPEGNLIVVADGMGGYKHGDIAAQYLTESLLANPDDHLKGLDVCRNKLVKEKDPDKRKSMTCFASVQITEDDTGKKYANILRAGDVKVLIIRNNEVIYKSKDESLTQQKIDKGMITPDQALYDHERNIVTNWVSAYSDNKSIEIPFSKPVQKGDIVLIYTDGISDNIQPDEIITLTKGKNPEDIIPTISEETGERMENWRKTYELTEEEGGREKLKQFYDGFKSAPKPDNRGVAVIQIN